MRNKGFIIVGIVFLLVAVMLVTVFQRPLSNNDAEEPKPSRDRVVKETKEEFGAFFGQDEEGTITLLQNNEIVVYELEEKLIKKFKESEVEVLDYVGFTYDTIGEDKIIKEIKKLPSSREEGTYLGKKDNIVEIQVNNKTISLKLTEEVIPVIEHVSNNDSVVFAYFEYKKDNYLSDIRRNTKDFNNVMGEFVSFEDGYIIINQNGKEMKMKFKEMSDTDVLENAYGYIDTNVDFKKGDLVIFDYYSLNGEEFLLNVEGLKKSSFFGEFVGIYDNNFIEVREGSDINVYELQSDLVGKITESSFNEEETIQLEYIERRGEKVITNVIGKGE